MSEIAKVSLAFLLLLAACEKAGDPVATTVNKAADAAEDRDADEVMKYLASTYPGRADVQDQLRRYFFAYRTVNVSIDQLETNHGASTGSATFLVNFTGVPKEIGGISELMPRTAVYRFDVDLIVENGEWKISAAQYTQEK